VPRLDVAEHGHRNWDEREPRADAGRIIAPSSLGPALVGGRWLVHHSRRL